jgi:hypothetical protein
MERSDAAVLAAATEPPTYQRRHAQVSTTEKRQQISAAGWVIGSAYRERNSGLVVELAMALSGFLPAHLACARRSI